ncbi:MAG: SCO family protein [Pseudomonadota bacterium]
MDKKMLMIAGAMAGAIGLAAVVFLVAMPPQKAETLANRAPASVNIDGATLGGPFALTTHKGDRVTDTDVIDGPTLVYFGYTFCPDVCPIDTNIMAEAVDLLAEQGMEVTPVFVTVDPARDTPTELGYFVEGMHPQMLGLTGTQEEIKAAADAYKVYYSRVEVPDSHAEYLMNHTAYTYLMMPDGIAALYRRGADAKELADDIAIVLRQKGVAG